MDWKKKKKKTSTWEILLSRVEYYIKYMRTRIRERVNMMQVKQYIGKNHLTNEGSKHVTEQNLDIRVNFPE